MKKYFVSGTIAAVLCIQSASQVVDTGGALWPFMPYHMYSDVYTEGASITLYELRLGDGHETELSPFTFRDAGLPRYTYAGLLRAAANRQEHLIASGEEGALHYLTDLVSASGHAGPARLWELRYVIDADGLRSRVPERRLAREWTVANLDTP